MKGYLIAPIQDTPNFANASGDQLSCRAYAVAVLLPGGFAAYIVGGTAAQLSALNALPRVYGICLESELDSMISNARRTRFNGWLTARGLPNIPTGWTYRQVLRAVVQRVQSGWLENRMAVADA